MDSNRDTRTGGKTLKGVEKAFNIIETLQTLESATLTEVATQMELAKSTAHIHLATLERAGYVLKEDGEYRLGFKFLEHGGHVRKQLRLYNAAKSEVEKLADKTGEAANLGIEENGKRILVYKEEVPDSIYDNAPTGERTHMHLTALGKAVLANLPRARAEEIIDQHGLPEATEFTITEPEALFEELAETRERGYSIEDQERRMGILAVGAPIFDRSRDTVVGSICLSGPKTRIEDRIDDGLIDDVTSAANVIELKYNHY